MAPALVPLHRDTGIEVLRRTLQVREPPLPPR